MSYSRERLLFLILSGKRVFLLKERWHGKLAAQRMADKALKELEDDKS